MADMFIQGMVMSFREGLEAFLIVMILLKYIEKSGKKNLSSKVWQGMSAGIFASVALGIGPMQFSAALGGVDALTKIWESIASLVAVLLITFFILWMIQHGKVMKKHVESEAQVNLSGKGMFLVTFFMVVREGVEIALFQFAGKYPLSSVVSGLALSLILVFMINYSLLKVKLQTIFAVTLAYLILQAGFLLGYSFHEGLSAAMDLGYVSGDSPLLTKLFDLSTTLLNHKEGVVGIILYVAVGWYSKPEVLQAILHYGYVLALLFYWKNYTHRRRSS